MSEAPLLTTRNLRVTYPSDEGDFVAVRDISFTLGRERLGIVGESGSGKSTTGRAIMGLVPHPGRVEADELKLGDVDLRGPVSKRGPRRALTPGPALIETSCSSACAGRGEMTAPPGGATAGDREPGRPSVRTRAYARRVIACMK